MNPINYPPTKYIDSYYSVPILLEQVQDINKDDKNLQPPTYYIFTNYIVRDIIDSSIVTRTRKLRQSKDFNIDGKILKFRPNRGYTANEKNANSKTCDLIFKGYYILYGDKGAYIARGKDSS